MKKTNLLIGLCLLPLLIHAADKSSPEKQAQHVIEEKVLKPLQGEMEVEQTFSRRLLMPASCEWGPVLEQGTRAFTVRTPQGGWLLGIYETAGEKIFILDLKVKSYVLLAEHPLFQHFKDG